MSDLLDYEINKELGECYLFMGEYEKATEYYEKAAESGSEFAAPKSCMLKLLNISKTLLKSKQQTPSLLAAWSKSPMLWTKSTKLFYL